MFFPLKKINIEVTVIKNQIFENIINLVYEPEKEIKGKCSSSIF